MTTKKLIQSLFLIILFLTLTSTLVAQGRFAKQINAIEQRSDHPQYEFQPNAKIFAFRLLQQGRRLFDEKQTSKLELAHTLLNYAHGASFAQNTPQQKARYARFQSEGQKELLELIESVPTVVRLKVDGGKITPIDQQEIKLVGGSGTILIKLDAGTDRTSLVIHPSEFNSYNLEAVSEDKPPFNFEYTPGETTWYLFRVTNGPANPLSMYISFKEKRSFKDPLRWYLHLKPEPTGHLMLDLVDENGDEVSAMLRLNFIYTWTIYRPPNAIDYYEQMGSIAGNPNPSEIRAANEPGDPMAYWMKGTATGHFYVVPGGFTMALPVGRYRVMAWKGNEYVPVYQDFDVTANESTYQKVVLKRWVDMTERGWISGDDHIHSRLMNDTDADRLMTWMDAADIHVGNVVTMGNYMRTFFEQRGYGKLYRVRKGNRVLVPGQEDPRYASGHSLGINLGHLVRDLNKYLYNDWVADEVRASGGLYGHAHLTYNGFNIRRDLTMLLPMGKSDFGEIMQNGDLEPSLLFEFANLGFKLTGTAGSDVPFGHGLGEVRYYAYTGEKNLDTDAWFDAMKAGHTFVSTGPVLDFTVDGALPGDEIQVTENKKLRVHAKAESSTFEGCELKSLKIIQFGKTIKEVTASDNSTYELELDFDLDAGHGMWLTARATSANGTEAMATPIYITRDGMRFWDMEQVPSLIQKCRQTLQGMTDEVSRFKAEEKTGDVEGWNLFSPMFLKLSPRHLENITNVHKLYNELEQQYQIEQALREDLGDN